MIDFSKELVASIFKVKLSKNSYLLDEKRSAPEELKLHQRLCETLKPRKWPVIFVEYLW